MQKYLIYLELQPQCCCIKSLRWNLTTLHTYTHTHYSVLCLNTLQFFWDYRSSTSNTCSRTRKHFTHDVLLCNTPFNLNGTITHESGRKSIAQDADFRIVGIFAWWRMTGNKHKIEGVDWLFVYLSITSTPPFLLRGGNVSTSLNVYEYRIQSCQMHPQN
jgi:hypothetical protein